jgi:ABC-type transport system involved in cytochrome bd biosynthesis fused ATPase/permease subunit
MTVFANSVFISSSLPFRSKCWRIHQNHLFFNGTALMADKTTIVIAHRLSTLKDMDRILVFVKGKIVEDGSLDGLLKDTNSHFYRLWQMQAEGFIQSIAE